MSVFKVVLAAVTAAAREMENHNQYQNNTPTALMIAIISNYLVYERM